MSLRTTIIIIATCISALLQQSKIAQGFETGCGEYLTAKKGVISTPNFPDAFQVPIKCKWVIDASETSYTNCSIVVYLTQLFVYKGLKFTEYAYYESETTHYGESLIREVTESNVFEYRWFKTYRPFLVIDFYLDRLEGNHVRVLDDLLDVYGFNITYEMTDKSANSESCSVRDCSYTGNCLVSLDYSTFFCDCFKGFNEDNCANGPLCSEFHPNTICQNDGTCRHIGARAVRCQCQPGYTGHRCEIPIANSLDNGLTGEDSVLHCPYPSKTRAPCSCKNGIRKNDNRSRYECTIKLANITSVRSSSNQQHISLETFIEKKLSKYLKNSSVSSLENLKILNVTDSAEVSFHFFGNSNDGDKILEALNRLVQLRRFGEISLQPTSLVFLQKPALKLQGLRVNQVNEREIRLGDQFILSCVAQGNAAINFTWYKDNMLVNMNKATREIWYRHLPSDGSETHTSLLTIDKATLLDAGQYTCQVIDRDVQQCKSIYIDVRDEPDVKIIPMSITVEKGSNVQMMCMTPNMRSVGIGFGWTKNRALLKLKPGSEVWEDLYPAGSVLKITNAQKSAIYTCNVAHRSMSVRLEVVNRTAIPICPRQKSWGLQWPETAPGSDAMLECPQQFVGRRVSRLCSMKDATTPEWQIPDFSYCLYEPLVTPYNNFRSLMLGYESTSGSKTISEIWTVLRSRKMPLNPGESDRLLSILAEIENYQSNTDLSDLTESIEPLTRIINYILIEESSLLNHQKLALLLQIMQRNLLYWSQRPFNDLHHLSLSSMVLDMIHVKQPKTSGFSYFTQTPMDNYTYPLWYKDKIIFQLNNRNSYSQSNATLISMAIVYKNVTRFLPNTYMKSLDDGTDLEYKINSRLVTITASPFSLDNNSKAWMNKTRWILQLSHLQNSTSSGSWNITCGLINAAGIWELNACSSITHYEESMTKCNCRTPGTYALFLTARAVRVVLATEERITSIVILGCICCLFQCLMTFFILIIYCLQNRTWLNFLKLQCCSALIGAMAIFVYAIHSNLPQSSYSWVSMSLEAFLLVGMSAPLSQALIVYSKLSNSHPSQHLQPTVIAVITGVPILAVLTTELIYKSTGWQHESWWLLSGSGVYNIFVSCSIIMILLFMLLYLRVTQKVHLLVEENVVKRETVEARLCMIHRAALAMSGIVAMEASSIYYINSMSPFSHYVFASISCLLGFIILVINVINREIILVVPLFRRLKCKTDEEGEQTSSEPIKVCSKGNNGEMDNDCQPMALVNESYVSVRGIAAGSADIIKYVNDSSTMYPKGAKPPTCSRFLPEIRIDHSDDINLENYKTSPRKYQESGFQTTTTAATRGYRMSELPNNRYREFPKFGTMQNKRQEMIESGDGALDAELSTAAKVLCAADVESRLGAMPDVTLPHVKAKVKAAELMTDGEIKEQLAAMPDIAANTTERKQPDGEEEKITSLINVDVPCNSMLASISHDLDYLLNRTNEEEATK